MRPEVKLFLLKIGRYNGDISPLIKMGYEYAQILQLIDGLLKEGLLVKDKFKHNLTDNGEVEIDRLNKLLDRKNSSIWIEPDNSSKVAKIDINDIFLPNQDELSF